MKRLLAAFLAFVMVLTMLATFSLASDTVRPAVWVMVNGGYDFFGADLTPYKGQDNTWVSIPLDISKLNSNAENYFSISTNVSSGGNLTDDSVDLYATSCENASGSYLCSDRWFNDFHGYNDRQINLKVQVLDNGQWRTVTEDAAYRADLSTVLGQYQGGDWYNAARNIVLAEDLSAFSRARILVNLHVGKEIAPLADDLMYTARVHFWHTVDAVAEEGGSVSGAPAGVVEEGTQVMLHAQPAEGYRFTGWYEGETKVSDSEAYGFAVQRSICLTARFAAQEPQTPEALLDYTKYNVQAYTAPLNRGTVVYQESALVVKNPDGSYPDLSLLYPITEIVSVRSSALDIEYVEGRDYTLSDGKLRILPGGNIPCLAYDELYLDSPIIGSSYASSDGGWLYSREGRTFHRLQISVTYRHAQTGYDGFVQPFKGALLPKTEAKLSAHAPLKIAFLGDSITYGLNVSGPVNTAPFTPSWASMTVEALNTVYGQNVTFENFGICGTTAAWGIDQMDSTVIPSKPDLLVVAFGMNDGAGSLSAADFTANLSSIVTKMRAANPDCEILLVSTTLPNPKIPEAYKTQPTYEEAMLALEAPGVAVVQMTSVHKSLLERKNFYDMTGSNLNHPNDFLARVYAQSLLSALIASPVTASATGAENQKVPARVSTEIPARPASGSTPELQVLVNEAVWTTLDLTSYLGQNDTWLEVPLEMSWLREGTNQFVFDSNVVNSANLAAGSLDIFASGAAAGAEDSYVSTNDMVYWNVMNGRRLNVKLELFDGTQWREAGSCAVNHSGGSLVIGKYLPDGQSYLSGRNIAAETLSGYTAARLLVNAHVGAALSTGREESGEAYAPALLVRLNDGAPAVLPLESLKGKDSVWVTVPLRTKDLKNGVNSVTVDSNVKNTANLGSTSVDLYFTASETVRDTYLSTDAMTTWVGYTDRYANVYLELLDPATGEWISCGKDAFRTNESTIIGQFLYGESATPYNMKREFSVPEGCTAVRAVIQLHVGSAVEGMYEAVPNCLVTAAAGEGGSVSGVPESEVPSGSEICLTATPENGYTFDGWYSGEEKVSGDAVYRFTVTQDIALTARFTRSTPEPEKPEPSEPEKPEPSEPENPKPSEPENPEPSKPEKPKPEAPETPRTGDRFSAALPLLAGFSLLCAIGLIAFIRKKKASV